MPDQTLRDFIIPVREYIGDIEGYNYPNPDGSPMLALLNEPDQSIVRWAKMMIERKESRWPEVNNPTTGQTIVITDPVWQVNPTSVITGKYTDRYVGLIGSMVKAFRLPYSDMSKKLPDGTSISEKLFQRDSEQLIRWLISDYIMEIIPNQGGQINDNQGIGQNLNSNWVQFLKQRDKVLQGIGIAVP